MIDRVWAMLFKVTKYRLDSQFDCGGQNGVVTGAVKVIASDKTIVFNERGLWSSGMAATNSYRWLRTDNRQLQLEHLRLGPDKPVHLVTLAQLGGNDQLETILPHVCGPDNYTATLSLSENALRLEWLINGVNKKGKLITTYR